jgi:hypothetical protein
MPNAVFISGITRPYKAAPIKETIDRENYFSIELSDQKIRESSRVRIAKGGALNLPL